MPVSTFSHGSTAVRFGARSEIVSRWNTTRERILQDERLQRNSHLQELDGTGIHFSESWPLRPASTSSTMEIEDKMLDDETAKEGSHHITSLTPEPEVQWVADNIEAERSLPTQRLSGSWPRRRTVLLPVSEEEDSRRVLKGCDSGTFESPPPNAEEALVTSITQRRAQESKASQEASQNGSETANTLDSSGEPIATAPSSTRVPSETSFVDRTSPTSDQSRRTSPTLDGEVATSISYTRKSSIAKSSILEDTSQRSSTYNPHSTTQITQNYDRVRYSWQSVRDEQPNRPRVTILKIVSTAASSSAGFPQGEAFGFSISPGGRRIAAYNSARLYILQTTPLPVGISQDFELKRRPLAVEVLDDGTFLAILSDQHTVNVYDLSQSRRCKTIKLDFPTYCIALAPMGGLLAAAYEGGVEIFSLDPAALPTDRRAVRSQRMDRMSFSQDGSTLLGTTTRVNASSSVIVNVPVFPASPDGVPTSEELKEAWCSELLHPENIRNSSHASFMREDGNTCNDRLFAWNGIADTFGVLNTTDLKYGNVDFPVVVSPPLSSCGGCGAAIKSAPALDEFGDTVAMIVNDRTVRLYIVPHKASESEAAVEAHSIDHELDEGYGCPFSDARWVYSDNSRPGQSNSQGHVQGRLLVTSPGGVGDSGLPEESVQDIEGGRIIMFDFDSQFSGQPTQTYSLALGKSPPQTLEEPEIDVADEVALIRRRTINQSKGGGLSQRPVTLGRAATTFNPARNGNRSNSPAFNLRRASSATSMNPGQSDAARSLPDLLETNEASESTAAIDEPFLNTAPRSQASLQRAASNAQRHRFQALEERSQQRMSADSAASFLPLPEYTEEPNAPLPSRFRVMAGLDSHPPNESKPAVVTKSNVRHSGGFQSQANTPSPAVGRSTVEQPFAGPVATTPTARGTRVNSAQPQIPRSLQRAYSHAVGRMGTGQAPTLIGDWQNVSPIGPNSENGFPASFNNGAPQSAAPRASSAAPRTSVEEPWNQTSSDTTRIPRYRHSTSLLNPPGHRTPHPSPNPAAPAYPQNARSMLPSQQNLNRHMPAYMQAFHDSSAASSSLPTSLFSAAQMPDHVPHRILEPISAVPHPVTAWHPPAPSSPAPAPDVPRGNARTPDVLRPNMRSADNLRSNMRSADDLSAHIRSPDALRATIRSPDVHRVNMRSPNSGHSRQASLVGKTATAFPATTKTKKLGFFKRKRKGVDDPRLSSAGAGTVTDRVPDLPGKNVPRSAWTSGKKIKKRESSSVSWKWW
jgi:hypothetical protein